MKNRLPKRKGKKKLLLTNGSNGNGSNGHLEKRAYKAVASLGGINSDWALNAIGEDSDVWQNQFALRQRSRDLFRTDVYFQKYTEELFANVFGYDGLRLRMRIKETEDRIVYAPSEKGFYLADGRRRKRVYDYVAWKYGKGHFSRHPAIEMLRSLETRATAQVLVGDLDLYANKLIQDRYTEWQRKEFCDVSGVRTYNEIRQIRLLSAARDGDHFIRLIRDPKINKFGFALQLINSEWCDFYFNHSLENGNEIRMGIERDKWGRRVAYHFIKRQPMDWQFSQPGAYNFSQGNQHERVPAEEIIHYARYRDGDSTRPAPWSASVIPKSRHLDKYEESEVVAARVAACKLGFFTSTVVPEGGAGVGDNPDPTKANNLEAEPGSFQGLGWGIDFKEWNPNHPNGNFDLFRKGVLRAWCAGMPGANYNIIANDLTGVNYSSGRLGMLDERELWKLLQKFDIETAERPIFEAWLEMSLMTGAIPLPLAKLEKFNQPLFRGRRWAWVDPLKEVQANALQVANKFTSRTRVVEDSDCDADFEEVLFELAEEEMLIAELGMDSAMVIGNKPGAEKPATDEASTEDTAGAAQPAATDAKKEGWQEEFESFTRVLTCLPEPEPERALALLGDRRSTFEKAINEADDMTIELFLYKLAAVMAAQQQRQIVPVAAAPAQVTPTNIINVPKAELTVDWSTFPGWPEQKAAQITVKPADVIVHPDKREMPKPVVNVTVNPTPVTVENKINMPKVTKVKIAREKSGKMSGADITHE